MTMGILVIGLMTPSALAADEHGTIKVGGLDRAYLAYVPDKLPGGAPLLFALHGTGGSGEGMRQETGAEFDRLADKNGFVAIYPTGFENTWDDCRKTDPSAAKQRKIDDIGFFRALVARFHEAHAIDPARIFIMGYSNGAQMAMRVALEAPDLVAAIAAVSANLPVPENSVCTASGKPVAALLMDGTADPINPYKGGEVILGRLGSRGFVQSGPATAEYWANLAGYRGGAEITILPHRAASDPTSVTVSDWHEPGKKNVVFYSIEGGGHVVPNPHFQFPAIVGRVTGDIDAPAEIWNFFGSLK
jgi:polyhydroxybutyrate depolymerase